MKYVPCSSSQCGVKVIDQSDQCVSCTTTVLPFSNRFRALQTSAGYQSSVITFEIDSTTPLNEDVVTSNLNSNITSANKDLAAIAPPLELKTNFTASTRMPTSSPSKQPVSSGRNLMQLESGQHSKIFLIALRPNSPQRALPKVQQKLLSVHPPLRLRRNSQ